MAAIALPISALEPIRLESREAQAETECVVVCSTKEDPDTATVWHIARKTFALKWRFARLTARQDKLIAWLSTTDFSQAPASDLTELAGKLDELIETEHQILSLAHSLGSEIRAWWTKSLALLADQVEHLESIAESLHVAADAESTSLLAVALEQIA